MWGEERIAAMQMLLESPERDLMIRFLILLAMDSDGSDVSYIALAEFFCGIKYQVFETVYVDGEMGVTTGVFRGHKYRCPEYDVFIRPNASL